MQTGAAILTHTIKIAREAAIALHLIEVDPGLNESLAVGHIKRVHRVVVIRLRRVGEDLHARALSAHRLDIPHGRAIGDQVGRLNHHGSFRPQAGVFNQRHEGGVGLLGAAVWPVNNHPCIGPQQLGGERAQPSFGGGSGVLLAYRYDALACCRQRRGLYRCGHFLWVAV